MTSLKDNPISTYLREARAELLKVSWPTRRVTILHAGLVIGISIALALFLGAFDFGMNKGLEAVLSFLHK